jgi:hypothetical protein
MKVFKVFGLKFESTAIEEIDQKDPDTVSNIINFSEIFSKPILVYKESNNSIIS